ncbi:MAG: lamin tail domain-containing protein [Caldilineaceae bacterium]
MQMKNSKQMNAFARRLMDITWRIGAIFPLLVIHVFMATIPVRAQQVPEIKINEVLAHTDPPQRDAVEFYNPTGAPVDISGWFITDNRNEPRKYQIPAGSIVGAEGFLVLNQDQTGMALSALGEEVYLFAADAAGNFTGYSHGFQFGASANGVSFGRYVTSTGVEHLPVERALTLGAPNAGPQIGPVVITGLAYGPLQEDEYIEFANITNATVQLYDRDAPENTWRVQGVGDYAFPRATEIPAKERFFLSPLTPDEFRVRHGIPAQVQVFGPYGGQLSDNGELIELMVPDDPNSDGSVPYIVAEAIEYEISAPWPVGPEIMRQFWTEYGNDPANWMSALLPELTNHIYLPIVQE